MEKTALLRAYCAGFHDMFDKGPANIVHALLTGIAGIYLIMVLTIYPLKMYQNRSCFQFWTIVSTFAASLSYMSLLNVMDTLGKSPFAHDGDCVNIDALLCSTERCIFHSIRSGYQEKELANAGSPTT